MATQIEVIDPALKANLSSHNVTQLFRRRLLIVLALFVAFLMPLSLSTLYFDFAGDKAIGPRNQIQLGWLGRQNPVKPILNWLDPPPPYPNEYGFQPGCDW
jgi:hypothetical protein